MKKTEKTKSIADEILNQDFPITYEDKSYDDKRAILREYAQRTEIAACVDVVADEIFACLSKDMIICPPDTLGDNVTALMKVMNISDISWHDVKSYLIDGYLAFEIIYVGDDPVGLKKLDPITLVPTVHGEKKIWTQYSDVPSQKRELYDTQVAFISYAEVSSRISYVESLMKPYINLKYMEDCFLISFTNVPGTRVNRIANVEDVKYMQQKFYAASRVPKSYLKYDGSFDFGKKSDTRWEKFIHKHAINFYSIYNKMMKTKIDITPKTIYL